LSISFVFQKLQKDQTKAMLNQFRDWLSAQDTETQKWGKIYIDECEHLEGIEYFTVEFDTLDELIADFKLYVDNCDE
jgi:hypothetical protein